ncbi:MAG: hypothetical protein MJZ41_07585 [Bacteroidaceae bacterium]|nr:hypothetical protein [Bacteroidaceae bacterium]
MNAQQLFTALKTKYPQSGLSDSEIMGLAVSLFATGLVTDENVNTIVDAQADAMKGFQSLFDKRFATQRDALKMTFETDFEKTFKEKYHIGEDGKQTITQQQTPPSDDLTAIIAKALDEKLKPISDRLDAEEARRAGELRTAQIIEKAKAHGISEELAKMFSVPSNVEDLDAFFKDKAQELTNLGFQPSVPPVKGGVQKTDGETFAEQIRAGAPKKE